MPHDLVETLGELIATPSVNPMGRPAMGPEFFETRMTAKLEEYFRILELPTERQTVEPGRDNILTRLDGTPSLEEGGELLLWEVHQDTVPITGMTIPPFTPEIRDGRMFGRGACDVKGGMAAMLNALSRLAAERHQQQIAPRPTLVLACTVSEEFGFTGVTALSKFWGQGSRMLPRAPDLAIVAEPTELQVVVAHKGVVRWRCHTHGRAAHSSQPQNGDNAIYRMARVVTALESYARDVAPRLGNHPRCGPATLSVGTIQGGMSVNIVPDRCTIEIDRRLMPLEQSLDVYQSIVEHVARAAGSAGVEHDRPFSINPGLADRLNGALAERLLAALRPFYPGAETVGVAYGTDAATISAAGIPAVVFGPGSIDQAHTADEWIDLGQLQVASDALYRFVAGTAQDIRRVPNASGAPPV